VAGAAVVVVHGVMTGRWLVRRCVDRYALTRAVCPSFEDRAVG